MPGSSFFKNGRPLVSKIIGVLFLLFTSQSFAARSPSPTPEEYSGIEGFVRLGCGYSFDVWDYINEKFPDMKARVIPAISQETFRYLVRAMDGTWLIAVEWQNPDPNSKDEDVACIVARGLRGTERTALAKPLGELPNGIISGRVSVPALKPVRSSKGVL
jgi:hypothetical protein